MQSKPLQQVLLFILTAFTLASLSGCGETHYFYAEATNGVYREPHRRMLDTFWVEAQASIYKADKLTVGIFIVRDMQAPFTDAVIDLQCKDFGVFGNGTLLTVAALSCVPATKIGAQMQLNATFSTRGKLPRNLLIKVPALTLSSIGVDGSKQQTATLPSFDVALELQEPTRYLSFH